MSNPLMKNKKEQWTPRLSGKQKQLFDSDKGVILAYGSRLSGKTTGSLHKLVKHAWETDGARVALVCKNGDTESWGGLNTFILDEWNGSGLSSEDGNAFSVISNDRLDSATRTRLTTIRNSHGTESSFMRVEIARDSDVEQRFLNTRFSAICLCGGQNFNDIEVFHGTTRQLRMHNIPPEKHLMLVDTNVPEDVKTHFLSDIFFNTDPAYQQAHSGFYGNMDVIQFTMEDAAENMSEFEIENLRDIYKNHTDGKRRFVEGAWDKE